MLDLNEYTDHMMMLLLGAFLLVGLGAILSGMANPFVITGLGLMLPIFLSWRAGIPYRLFASALFVLAIGVFLAAVPWIRERNLQFWPVLFTYALIFWALWRLPNRQKPGILCWMLWIVILITTCYLFFWRWHLHQMPWKSFTFAFGNLVWLLAVLPALQAALQAKAPYGRFLLVSGILIDWLAALFHGIDANGWNMSNPLFPESMWFIGNTLFGLGIYYESQQRDVGIGPFILSIGSLEIGWVTGILGLKALDSPFFMAWLLIGAILLFICACLFILGYQQALLDAERRLRAWLHLLDDLSHVAEEGHSTIGGLQILFHRLQEAVPGLLGATLQVGKQSYVIGTKGPHMLALQESAGNPAIGYLYANDSAVFQDLRSINHLLSTRLREIALKLDYKSESLVDPLTRLLNRRGLSHRLTDLIRECRLRQSPCAVLAIDLDHFKKINDTHGHEAGDRVLKATAQTMLNIFRDEDLCVRWGGEEFLVILPNANLEEAKAAAERFLKALSSLDLGLGWPVTASIGVAGGEIPNTQEDFVHWRNKADQACYLAKQQGRNRVVCHQGGQSNNVLDISP